MKKKDQNHGCVGAIHQPNFFPWIGYFRKIKLADKFVFLDEVSYPRQGSKSMGSICNRVNIEKNGSMSRISAPIKKARLGTKINEINFASGTEWRDNVIKHIELSYSNAPNFKSIIPLLNKLMAFQTCSLSDFNINAIEGISRFLGLQCDFVKQSHLITKAHSTELLVEILKVTGATTYLSGNGASGYMKSELFEQKSINLIFVPNDEIFYRKDGVELQGLSIIDFLMHSSDFTAI